MQKKPLLNVTRSLTLGRYLFACSFTQEFLPEVKLLIDVKEMRRTADHPHVRRQQAAAEAAIMVRIGYSLCHCKAGLFGRLVLITLIVRPTE